MKFNQPCFIRMNTPEIRDRLRKFGYNTCPCCTFNNAVWIQNFTYNSTAHGVGYFEEDPPYDWNVEKELELFLIQNTHYIDCGTNINLFLAIAALTNDTDENQYFCDWDGRFWKEIERESFGKTKWVYGEHKATVSELIEHFK